MATLGWPGWRSIWAPPKGGEAATVPCNYKPHKRTRNGATILALDGKSGNIGTNMKSTKSNNLPCSTVLVCMLSFDKAPTTAIGSPPCRFTVSIHRVVPKCSPCPFGWYRSTSASQQLIAYADLSLVFCTR
jgi:hypothetical protein